jgi:hypothetical protein
MIQKIVGNRNKNKNTSNYHNLVKIVLFVRQIMQLKGSREADLCVPREENEAVCISSADLYLVRIRSNTTEAYSPNNPLYLYLPMQVRYQSNVNLQLQLF